MTRHYTIVRVPKWKFSMEKDADPSYYGWKYWAHIGPFMIGFGRFYP